MSRTALLALALTLVAVTAVAANRSVRKLDAFWSSPEPGALDVRSIAFLPVATFDGNIEARRLTEEAVGKALRSSGHRWVSTLVTREMMRRAGGDSLAKAFNQKMLENPRLDSLDAPYFSRLTRSRALFTVRVEQFEKREKEFNQNGMPTTTVQLVAPGYPETLGKLLARWADAFPRLAAADSSAVR